MNDLELEKVFIGMIHTYERVIYKVCSFYVSEEYPMPDLYQEVVYNLWKGYPKFRNECSESTWIYRVALNTCISGMRKESRKPENVSVAALDKAFVEPDDFEEEKIKELYGLIYKLKTVERAIVLLYLEEKSYQEIADITGLTVNNVATKLNRIKTKLKKMSGY